MYSFAMVRTSPGLLSVFRNTFERFRFLNGVTAIHVAAIMLGLHETLQQDILSRWE